MGLTARMDSLAERADITINLIEELREKDPTHTLLKLVDQNLRFTDGYYIKYLGQERMEEFQSKRKKLGRFATLEDERQCLIGYCRDLENALKAESLR